MESDSRWISYSPELFDQIGQRVGNSQLGSDRNLRAVRSAENPQLPDLPDNHTYYLHLAPETIRPIITSQKLNEFAERLLGGIPVKQHFAAEFTEKNSLRVPLFYYAEQARTGRRTILARVYPDATAATAAAEIRQGWLSEFDRKIEINDIWKLVLEYYSKKLFLREDSRMRLMNGHIARDWVKRLESGDPEPFSNLATKITRAVSRK